MHNETPLRWRPNTYFMYQTVAKTKHLSVIVGTYPGLTNTVFN